MSSGSSWRFHPSLLVFLRREPSAVAAGFRYLLVHIFGGLILLAGILLHWSQTGSLAFGDMGAFSSGGLAWALILVAFLLNAAVPPLGAWLPDAYPEATVTGAVFMTAFTTKSAVYVLIRGYAGTELLVWLGAAMAVYGVVYAVLENDARRLLAYHIISQVGYMVCGVGIGTALATNGATAHAFAHILYKALLFMGAGAVLQTTGLRKLSEMGGLYKTMPVTLGLYMIGAFAISAVPLFSGFVSKSMVISAAGETHRTAIFLMLTLASAGTFLHTGLKLPYYMFFGKDSGRARTGASRNMLVAMGLAAVACVLIGVFPGLLYQYLPNPVDFVPYTLRHVTSTLGMLSFTALGFFLLLKHLDPVPTISLDTDWFYRRGSAFLVTLVRGPLARLESDFVGQIYEFVIQRPVLGVAYLLRKLDSFVVDFAIVGRGTFHPELEPGLKDPGERQRPALRTVHGGRDSGTPGPGNFRAMTAYPVLTTTTFLPLAGAAVILFGSDRLARWTALITTLATLAVSAPLYWHFDKASGALQFVESAALDPIVEHRLRHGRGWHQPPIHLSRRTAERPMHWRLVDRGPNQSAGILRRAAGR